MKTEFWSKLSSISEIVSSIAIVITLVYLTIQVQQNTEAINSSSRQVVLTSAQAELFMRVENPGIDLALAKEGPLTKEEQILVNGWLQGVLRARHFSWLQYRSGSIDETQWATEENIISIVLNSPNARKWWINSGQTAFSGEFSDFVNELIKDQPATNEIWSTTYTWADD
jgi:hypothetical protein